MSGFRFNSSGDGPRKWHVLKIPLLILMTSLDWELQIWSKPLILQLGKWRRWVVFPGDTQVAGSRTDPALYPWSGEGETPRSLAWQRWSPRVPASVRICVPMVMFPKADSQAEHDHGPQDGCGVATSPAAPGISSENATFPLGLYHTPGFCCLFP